MPTSLQGTLEHVPPSPVRAPRLADAAGLEGQEVLLDVTGLGGADAEAEIAAAREVLERASSEGHAVALCGEIGRIGESRCETVLKTRALWDLFETYRERTPITFRLRFPRIPDDEPDPLARRWEGPAQIPTSPLEAPPRDELAVWELRTLRQLLTIRRDFSHTRKVIINLTYKCNNYCTFCAVGNRLYENGDFEFHKRMLREYRERGCDLADFDGGEPTIYPQLLKIIKYARHLGYRQVNVTSNGRTMSHAPTCERILQSGITTLCISCHGPTAAIHDERVAVKGAFNQTVQGIANVVAMKPAWLDFAVNITLTNGNYEELPAYFKLMHTLRVPKLNIQFLTPFGRTDESIVPDPANIAPILKPLLDEYGDKMVIYLINVPFCYFQGYERFVTGDVLKLERNMVFVTQEKVNLFKYLAGTRKREACCDECAFAVACEGFYCFDEIWD
jgi:MoaA/NifB/PqqE/SkfB family radical SAM enzyme